MHQRLRRKLLAAAVTLGVALSGLVVPPAGAATQSTRTKSSTAKSTAAKSSRAASTKSAVAKSTAPKATATSSKKKATSTKAKAPTTRKARYVSSRRARAARLAAARRAREAREVANPLFQLDAAGNLVPDVRAAAAIIYNPVTQQVLWEENAEATRSIASITKVMTAIVLLDHEFDLSRTVTVDYASVRGARHTYLRSKDSVRVDDLLNLMLIASDNAAARVLAKASPLGYDSFIERMNTKAVELGLTHTHYTDPSGLDSGNVSSALDMARLIAFASGDERVASIMRKSDYRVVTARRQIVVHNTNRLLGSDVQVQAGKTGFIRDAGYCLATLLRLPQGDPVAVVVLGARSSAGRFMETRHLFNWVTAKASTLLASPEPSPVPPTFEQP